MSSASLSTELTPSSYPDARRQDTNAIDRTWQTTRFSLQCLAAPCINFKTFTLHVPDGCRAPREEILEVEIMGEHPVALGGYWDIWQGRLKSDTSPACELVAVKVLRHFGGNASQYTFSKHLQREVRIWSQLHHESIAVFHGIIYHSDGTPAMISPWYPNGSADVYLRNHRSANPMKLIWEITLGVQYLHHHDVVHGDLKGANIMVDDSGHAKLIDFGLSRLVEAVVGPSGLTLSTVSFSIRWCAPELVLVDNAQVTTATDVYAWASTTLQLLTGAVPYSAHREITILKTILDKSPPQRPTSPSSMWIHFGIF